MVASRVALLRLPFLRGLSPRRALVPVAAFVVVAVVFGRLAREHAHPADAVLLETVAPALIPLATFALVRATLGGLSLAAAAEPLVDFGARAREAAIAHALVATLLAALSAAVVTGAALLAVHDGAGELLRATAIAGGAGAAYGALFTAGASFGRSGGGAIFVLAADALVGSGYGSLAALTPRAHLRSLLGGIPPIDLGARASFVALAVMVAFASLVVTARTRRPPR